MKTKILTIGDEILIGQILNSNSSFISKKLFEIGIPVDKIVTIGDVEDNLINELKDSLRKYDITIITGGLGPTHDDKTKPILVKFFKDELIFNQSVLKQLLKMSSARGQKLTTVNRNQALFPKKAKVIFNYNGTAPGIWYEKNRKVIIALPGVPIEMQEMISKQLVPLLKNKFKTKLTNHYKNKTILTTGITESALFEKLGNIEEIVGTGNLAFLPSPSGVRLRIDVNGKSLSEINKKINVIENKIRQKAGEYIYGTEDDSLEEIMGKRLKKMRLTLSIAESCTGGLLSSKITDVSGSSEYFIGGIITYSNAAKIKQLGVKKSTIVRYGAVSEQTAKEMAENVRKKFKTDIGLSITGIAGPKGGTKDKPVGLVWIGYSDYRLTSSRKFLFGMNRAKNKLRAGTAALYILNSNLFHYIY